MHEMSCDVLIAGGGLGGCAAALAAAGMGRRIIMTEETDWIGGQLTSQAVPPDEHAWIEQFGATRRYRELRNRIRDYYRRNYPLTTDANQKWNLNPGNGSVSRLCHEPRVAVAVLHEMLAPHIHSGRVTLFLRHKPIRAEVDGDQVRAVTFLNLESGEERIFTPKIVLDATEIGDLLPLTGTEYVTGSESRDDTCEPHAHQGPSKPLNMQAITYCFAMDYLPGENHTIDKPEMYDFWRGYVPDVSPPWTGKLLDYTYPQPSTLKPITSSVVEPVEGHYDFWKYRRIIDQSNFLRGTYESDITIVNWPQTDYFVGPVYEVSEAEVDKHLYQAKQLSLSFLYWMQTEAPRLDGGLGYRGLRLRSDVVGTEDGLAKYPYIRESRRIKAQFTVLEQHIGRPSRPDGKAEYFHDSVGIGYYHLDLHPSTGGDNYIDFGACPFQIPLGSLLPIRMKNLLPAAKNIGTTHVTNGSYRLHPVEWNIGESAGLLADFCLTHGIPPEAVRQKTHLAHFQRLLRSEGIELNWPNIGPDAH